MLEHFKRSFGARSNSSSESWAHTDLWAAMESAAQNAPLFIESFYDGCEELRRKSAEWFPNDIKLAMRDCILKVLWPKDDIVGFFKTNCVFQSKTSSDSTAIRAVIPV